ncbi:B-cell receptor CD22-like [Pundamilia nyererei]|uniref:B-cell receptor CD22 n=1 Tax=Pundamilia nyererei TaxID=303518 RepID=A0A9Y6JL03_9CICH|nr:PREDICTED: B-cell receptor CD22-like [Pundamilia nyererei]
MRGAAMSLSAAASGFVLFLLSLTVVESQDNYGVTYTSTQICAVKGSTVDIGCSFKHPSRYTYLWNTVWFTKGNNNNPDDLKTDPVYAGRVSYSSHWKSCTLTIRDLRESDSAVYKFRFETNQKSFTVLPGVTLTVTDLQVKVSRIISVHESQTEAELKCESSCSPAGRLSFVWFKNNQFMVERRSYQDLFNPGDIISCAFKGHEGYRSDPVYIPKLPSVSVSPSAEIVEGSSVTLTCSSDANPAANYTWYKEQQPISQEKQIIFRSIWFSDSGKYCCTAENELGKTISKVISINVKCE